MSSELERVIGVLACPLPLFNENLASALKIPEALRPIVADCRRIVIFSENHASRTGLTRTPCRCDAREIQSLLKLSEVRCAKLEYELQDLLRRVYGPKNESLNPDQRALCQNNVAWWRDARDMA
jgi:hypothetical protein